MLRAPRGVVLADPGKGAITPAGLLKFWVYPYSATLIKNRALCSIPCPLSQPHAYRPFFALTFFPQILQERVASKWVNLCFRSVSLSLKHFPHNEQGMFKKTLTILCFLICSLRPVDVSKIFSQSS